MKTTCKAHNTKQFSIWKTTSKAHNTKQFSSKDNMQILQNQAILYWKQLANLTIESNSLFDNLQCSQHQPILHLKKTHKAHNTKQFSSKDNMQILQIQAILYWKQLANLTI